jgi:uncharacterized protein YndB with AHSA1/START domain
MLGGMSGPVHSDHRAAFPVPVDRLWEHLVAVDRYRSWWPWLRRLDARAVAEGEVWHCTIQGRVPYRLRLRITLVEVDPTSGVRADVAGDLTGWASFALAPDGPGRSTLHLRSELAPASRLVRAVAAVAPGIARRGHDRIVTGGLDRVRSDLHHPR